MDRAKGGSLRALGLAFGVYLLLSVLMWWQVWSTHPSTVTTCGCGDTALFLWFLEWPAYALVHGHNPLYSTALFHPAGINLLSNTSVLAVGIPLAPVTLLFGPVATLNVASTLAPALSAVAMCWLLLRWVSWRPAAFVGGLVFGFSPFVVVSLAGAHLMTGTLVLVPLIVACLDDLLVRQRHRPLTVGLALGVLVAVEFFVSTEVLVIVAVCAVVGIVLVVVYGALARRTAFAGHTPYALRGLGAGAITASLLLAYPLWFALAGPAHLSGLVWPALGPGAGPAHLSNLVGLHFMSPAFAHQMRVWGGYQGPRLPLPEYIGLGAVVVAALSLVVWRSDRRLWFFGALGTITGALSLGLSVPWRLFAHVPVLQNVIPGRFQIATTFSLAIVLAVCTDRVRLQAANVERERLRRRVLPGAGRNRVGSTGPTPGARTWRPAPGWATSGPSGRSALPRSRVLVGRVVPAVAALAIAAVALVPMAGAVAGNTPITTRPVTLPRWFADVATHLPPRQVVLAYPAPFSLVESSMAWQAVDRLDFAMAGGGGPEAIPARAGRERAGFVVLSEASVSLPAPPAQTADNVEAVRSALVGWGVTTVVVPDPRGLPSYDRGTDVHTALRLFTAVTGREPRYEEGAWVWTGLNASAVPRVQSTGARDP